MGMAFLSAALRANALQKHCGNNGAMLIARRMLGFTAPAKAAGGDEVSLSGFDFPEYTTAKRRAVSEALDVAVPLRHPLKLHESMRYTLLGHSGTRLAALLVFAACDFVGGGQTAATPFACAAEMLVAMAVVHDDLPCMDDATIRRGRPANHLVFGEPTALLASHALLSLAFQHVAAAAGASPEVVAKAVVEIGEAMSSVTGMMAGQFMDKESQGKDIDMDTLRNIYRCKTGRLAEATLVCGAIAGGGREEEVEKLRRCARPLGLLCQVMDDISDAGEDVAAGEINCTKLLGLDGAKKLAGELLAQTEAELAGTDVKRAAPLYALACFVAKGKRFNNPSSILNEKNK